MKHLFTIILLTFLILQSNAQVTLTLLNDVKLTPTAQDTSGVFCRAFYHSGRNKFYVVYASRGISSPPGFNQYYRWEEYNTNLISTGIRGTLPGVGNGGGDYAMVMVGNSYYHVTGTGMSAWQYRLTKFDEDFNLISTSTFAIDSADSKADMMMNYTNGRLIIGAFHQPGVNHPTMPVQSPAWTPQMHKWEFDTSLTQIGSDVYLNEMFTTWGSSCIFNSNMYNIVTFDKWKGHYAGVFDLNVYRYDSNWNYIDTKPLNNDGQWSQGVLWDGNYYYVAYHTGHIHRGGNITVSVYDSTWNPITALQITNNQIFDTLNFQPTLNTIQYNANRPFLTLVNDTLYVSYDQDDYTCTGYTPVPLYNEGKRWQAHVAAIKLNFTTGINDNKDEPILNIYPNPTSSRINFQCNEKGSIDIYNSNGRIILRGRVIQGVNTLSLPENCRGLFLLQLTTEKGSTQQKFLIE